MDLGRPFAAVTPTLDGDVLAALARVDAELTGRQLQGVIGHSSVEGVRRAAERLVRQGIVHRRAVGRAHVYRLNREHVAAAAVERLAALDQELLDRLRTAIAAWTPAPVAAVLFGSAARGEAGADSDLDLLVIRPSAVDPDDDRWRAQLTELAERATAWSGNDARVLEYGEEELDFREPEPVLAQALHEGLALHGRPSELRRLARTVAA